eukprot:gene8077-8941_t
MPKRKREDDCYCEHHSADIFQFPDNVMLTILGYLDTSSLVRASRVCKKWFSLSKDCSLWRKLDLRGRTKALTAKNLWKLSRAHFTAALRELHLRGSVGPSKAILDPITVPFLEHIKQQCPNLTCLTLENFDLRQSSLNISLLPHQLTYLSLKDSMLSHGWFESLKNNTFNMDAIKVLDLSNCTVISNSDLEAFSYLRSLQTLLLYNCYRISARGIPTIAANLRSLSTLDVSCCPGINDVALHYFGRNLLSLKKLNLRFCHHITDGGITSLVYGTREIEHLDIFSCHEVTNQSLKNIAQYSKKLKYLDVRSCKVTKDGVLDLAGSIPTCNIIYFDDSPMAQTSYHSCSHHLH